MLDRNDDASEHLGPSRSQQRRDALAVFELAERLAALGDGQLSVIPMPDELRELVRDSRRITSQIARKRELQFLAKAMRKEDDEVIDAIRRALEHDRDEARRDTARLHRLEVWRERLMGEDDAALTELLDEYPSANRQELRQLIRNAKIEREKQRPPHAFRELFRNLKELIDETPDNADPTE